MAFKKSLLHFKDLIPFILDSKTNDRIRDANSSEEMIVFVCFVFNNFVKHDI